MAALRGSGAETGRPAAEDPLSAFSPELARDQRRLAVTAASALLAATALVALLTSPHWASNGNGGALRHRARNSGAFTAERGSPDLESVAPPSRAYFINLEASSDRRAHMERSLAAFPGKTLRVAAVSSGHVENAPLSGYARRQGLDDALQRLKPEAARKVVSCWLSHVKLWERLQSELAPEEAALVLEDDVQFPSNWTASLGATVRSAPRGWHVLKVCGWGSERAADVVDENWAVPRWPLRDGDAWRYAGSCGYIVTGSSVRKLLSHVLSQPVKDIDVAMMLPEKAEVSEGYSIYEQRPGRRLLGVGGFASTIRDGADGYGYEGYASSYGASGSASGTPSAHRYAGEPLFEVVSGSCRMEGDCVTSPNYPRNYDSYQDCKIRMAVDGYLFTEDFDTEEDYDELQVRSHTFSGEGNSSGPANLYVDQWDVFSWHSDGSNNYRGFRVCLKPMVEKPVLFVKSGKCQVVTDGDTCITSPNFPSTYESGGDCRIEIDKSGMLSAEYFHTRPAAAGIRNMLEDYQCLNGGQEKPRMDRCTESMGFAWYNDTDSQLRVYAGGWGSGDCLRYNGSTLTVASCPSSTADSFTWRFEGTALKSNASSTKCLTWKYHGDCSSTFEDWEGEDLEEVMVSGGSDSEFDAACCSKCKERDGCVFWVREKGSSGHIKCSLRTKPGKETSNSDLRGGWIDGGGLVMMADCDGSKEQQWEFFGGENLGDSLVVGKSAAFSLDKGPHEMEVDGGTQMKWRLSSTSFPDIFEPDLTPAWKICYKKSRFVPVVLISVVLLQIAMWGGLYAYHRWWLKSISRTAAHSKVAQQSEDFSTALLKRFSPKKSVSSYRFRGMEKKSATVSLQFQDLGLTLKNGACVLEGVTGEFTAGKMIGILGPSGAGKTTFMNVLCGKATYGVMMGKVQVNGQECDIRSIKSVMGFVPQDDVVHERLTVRENFEFSARLRLPPGTTREQQSAVVEDILNIMQVVHIQTSIVGGVEERGISGGQRKRVNIGLELAACPTLLFLDEPTSGLDATSSLSILTSLKKMTQLGVTVIMVIHQPRYSLFTLFDDVLLLGKGGRTVYLGPSVGAVDYFAGLGFKLPAKENPADWLMDIISGEVPNEKTPKFKPPLLFSSWEAKKKSLPQAQEPASRDDEQEDKAMLMKLLEDEWDLIDKDGSKTLDVEELRTLLRGCAGAEPDEEVLDQLMARMGTSESPVGGGNRSEKVVKKAAFMEFVAGLQGVTAQDAVALKSATRVTSAEYGGAESPLLEGTSTSLARAMPSPFSQYLTIVTRRAVQVFRNSARRTVDSGLILGCALIAGCMHRGKMGVDKENLPFNLMIFHLGLSLLTMVSAVRVFGADRPVFWRESSSGVSVAAFFFGRLTVAALDMVFQCVLYVSVYFLVCAPGHPSGYFPEYLWPCVLIAFTAGGWGYLISTLVPPENAVMGAVVFSLVFGGILGDPTTIGDYIKSTPFDCLTTISLTRWSVQMTFQKTMDRASDMNIMVAPALYKFSNDYQESALGLSGWNASIKVLLFEAVLLRALGYLGLKYMNRSKQV